MIFGRSVGRIKESESDKQFHSKKDKFTITKGTQNQSNIRLVRLMFYLPNITGALPLMTHCLLQQKINWFIHDS